VDAFAVDQVDAANEAVDVTNNLAAARNSPVAKVIVSAFR
jgi:hypothetical protein